MNAETTTTNQEKPRCDFYYVLMTEDGLYLDDYGLIPCGTLLSAAKWYVEDSAKQIRDGEKLNAKVYKVHSPIIECCEVETVRDSKEETKIEGPSVLSADTLGKMMEKW